MNHSVVSHDEWLKARVSLLAKEKEFMTEQDKFRAEQRALPWEKVEKNYVFDSVDGSVSLAGLFRGRSQLFVKHFMLAPGRTTQCVGCSLEVDHVEALLEHIENHDISYMSVSRAPLEEIEAVRQRMGWEFTWVSSFNSDFSYDYFASFKPEELVACRAYSNNRFTNSASEDVAGNSVFYKDTNDDIFHTYSTFGRGGEQFLGIYSIFDIVPKGREENGPTHSLPDWARPRTMYGKGGQVDRSGAYSHAEHRHC
jgi:predicted dithiol-disulfide oxidoreductase (DUF899 family)